MVTKWKCWTAHPAAKIISFLLIVMFFFLAMNSLVSFARIRYESDISPTVAFYDKSGNQYFYEHNMPLMYDTASQIVYYQSEAAISSGKFLKWIDDEIVSYGTHLCFVTPDTIFPYRSLLPREDTPLARENMEREAILQQIIWFRTALDNLNTDGFIYYLSGGVSENEDSTINESETDFGLESVSYSNVDFVDQNRDFFRFQPLYFLKDPYKQPTTSHSNSAIRHESTPANATVFLAYTTDFIASQNNLYTEARNGYIQELLTMAISAILMLIFLFVLLFGTGRHFNSDNNEIQLLTIDRPYLDISLVVVLIWTLIVVSVTEPIIQTIWDSPAVTWILALSASLVFTSILLWFMSLIKRIKAGRFWRHTFLFAASHRIFLFCKSLWSGLILTAKVALISFVSFVLLLYMGITISQGHVAPGILLILLITAAVTYLLLRYANRLHRLDQAARKISQGDYDIRIDVGNGELGNIAASISDISTGLSTAVEQRLKSERLKTELITNVSHDIRTPLTSIITYADLLNREGLTSEKASEYLDILTQKSQRLKTLTEELFEAAKATSGNIEVNITELDLASLIKQVLGELDQAIATSGLDLRVKLPDHLLVKADGKLMWRVMENLLSNVFKYALSGSRVYLNAEREDLFVRVDIKNISSAELSGDPSELTERFKRGDESRSNSGSGLGLSIVQSFVAAQNGRFIITIDGDLFKATVYLPDSSTP